MLLELAKKVLKWTIL